jgi:MFS transporter, putative metabolite transport protein
MTTSIIDDAPYTGFHRKLTFLTAGGPFLDGFILSILGIVTLAVSTELAPTPLEFGLLGASTLIGLFVGGFAGPLTDRIGRKLMFTLDLAVLCVASLLCLFVQDVWQLIALRFIVGIGIGADYPIATSMLVEWLPARTRGRAMSMLIVWMLGGACVAAATGVAVIEIFGEGAWRWALASAALPAAIIMIARHGTPESPRWLIRKGRSEEARASLSKMLGRTCSDSELRSVVDAEHNDQNQVASKTGYRLLFHGRNLRNIIFACVIWTAGIVPVFALGAFAPFIVASFGVQELELWATLLFNVVALVGTLPALWLIERVGRRPLLIGSFVVMTATLLILGLFPAAGAVVVIGCFCLYQFATGGPNILDLVYPNELFPTDIRATAVGFATSMSRIGAAVGTFLVPVGMAEWGVGPIVMGGAVISGIGLLVAITMAPETRGMTLAEAATGAVRTVKTRESRRALNRVE